MGGWESKEVREKGGRRRRKKNENEEEREENSFLKQIKCKK